MRRLFARLNRFLRRSHLSAGVEDVPDRNDGKENVPAEATTIECEKPELEDVSAEAIFEDSGTGSILVYQMGKVGSKSVHETLTSLELSVPIYHIHLLNDLDAIEDFVLRSRPNPDETLQQIRRGRELRASIDEADSKSFSVITLVREPVGRNLSAYFQNIEEMIPDVYSREDIDISELADSFLKKYDHNGPISWFDRQLKPVFSVDVFASEFPKERGYQIYKAEKARILLIRMEDLDRCFEPAIAEFMGIRDVHLQRSNIGSRKAYSHLYEQLLKSIVLPANYLDRMYDSKYCRHFYSKPEIDKFRTRWTA